ncbi:hypothetical protein KB553_22335 [Chryseobacterium rhizoplanae]|uniref:hypothetical protein n=1 Tax=Chryseobacterium rhizoplanae TaxID=1609531 RepID=UPI001CE385A1|nr:hypothetical protein [Chryseobacterium rhizoplanae]UCA59709.1 hypothetical protein KB553_22335 [Chryseobacterium rhizoplanae]
MKNIFLLACIMIVNISCKKSNTIQDNNTQSTLSKTDTTFQFKPIGLETIKEYSFPKEWKVNTYSEENVSLNSDDINSQTKLEKIDYFNTIKGTKNEYTNPDYFNFIKQDSILKLSKIDSLFITDSTNLHDGRKLLTFKTVATLDSDEYEFPIKIFKVDVAIFKGKNILQSENIFSEIDYPYATKQNTCYLDKNGNLECKKFNIDEDKVYFEGSSKKNLKQIFNIK